MKKINLLIISPYKGMEEIVNEIIDLEEDVTADCYIANLNETETLLKEINFYDYDAILSRGGTASYLQQHTKLPVYDIGLSALDALRAIHLGQNFQRPMAIIGFEAITRTAQMLLEVLQYDIPIYTVYDVSEVEPQLLQLKASGISVVVCDVISSRIATDLNMTSVMVTSGYETIQAAIHQAISLIGGYINSRQEFSHLTVSFQNSPVNCTIFDSQGNIVLTNLSTQQSDLILPYLKNHFAEFWTEEAESFERPLKGSLISVIQKKVYLKGERFLYVYTHVQERVESRKITAIKQKNAISNLQMDYADFTSSQSLTSTQDILEKYSHTLFPVTISGENGVSKDKAAYYIYCKSPYSHAIFYEINCETATERNWNFLLSSHDSPLVRNKHTLYFRHINALSPQIFQQLMAFIIDTNMHSRNRLIFSFVLLRHERIPASMTELMKQVNSLSLHLPSLRERKDDIPFLTTIYINQFNATLGKQIVGFDARALKALQTFPWDNNLNQLQRIIRELMLITTNAYISYENTMRLLHKETSLWLSDENTAYQFDLSQTLDDITYDVIRMVLKEEENNQSAAAKRLGIGRSTLWRILKSHEGENA